MRVNDGLDGEVNLPEAEYVCCGCHRTWDNVCAQCTSYVYESSARVTSPSIRVTKRPMASRTSSVRVNDHPDGEVNLPKAEYVGLGGCT